MFIWTRLRRFIRSQYPALAFKNYRYFFNASLGSVGATQLTQMGQGWLIYELSNSALMLGILGFCIAFPNLVVNLPGGVFADRLNKKHLLAITNVVNGAVVLVLAVLVLLDLTQVWHVLLSAAVISAVNGLDWPVRVSIYPHLLPRDGYLSAIALNSFLWQITRMVIPAIGGYILQFLGNGWLFLFCAAGFITMTITMCLLRIEHTPVVSQSSPLADLIEGVKFVAVQPLFRYLLLLTFVGMLFCNSHVQIMPIFAELVGGSETAFGMLLASGGLGAIIGATIIGSARRLAQVGVVLTSTGLLSIILTFGFAVVAHLGFFIPALILQFACAAFATMFVISVLTVLQLRVPNRLRGRVMGIQTMGFSLIPLGGLFIGYLVELSTVIIAMAIGCGIYALVLLAVMYRRRDIRSLNSSQLSEAQI